MSARRGAAIELAVVELAFLAVLARLWAAQQALWTNGFDPLDPFAAPRYQADAAGAPRPAQAPSGGCSSSSARSVR